MAETDSSNAIKLIVMGSGGVGKSAMTVRFTAGNFVEHYDPTIEDSYQKTVVVDGAAVHLEILDTAGQEEYSALRETFMATGHGFVLVYSVTDDASFEKLTEMHERIKTIMGERKESDIPIVLVANKCDVAEEDKAVDRSEGENLQATFGATHFFETSAKQNLNVEECFLALTQTILKKNPNAGKGGGAGAVFGADAAHAYKKRQKCSIL